MLNSLEQAKLLRKIAINADRISRLESFLKGQTLGTVRFVDASIINAKIGSLSASKLTTGILAVGTEFQIGDPDFGNYILKDGDSVQILMYDSGNVQLVIGTVGGNNTVRIALPGYDALTDTNLDHFALYADEDNILIKEKARGTFNSDYGDRTTIPHGLAYIPAFLGWGINEDGDLVLAEISNAFSFSNMYIASCDATNLYIDNGMGDNLDFYYFIFFDNLT